MLINKRKKQETSEKNSKEQQTNSADAVTCTNDLRSLVHIGALHSADHYTIEKVRIVYCKTAQRNAST